ncbi:MAG: hypothetical protein NVSMB39_1780 [Candidatus Saccharimonadales bacterium]
MPNNIPQDPYWQKPVEARDKLRSYIGFRQWKLSTLAGESPRDIGTYKTRPKFSDDFTLRSIHVGYNWVPAGNVAYCNWNQRPHVVPGADCICGLYCSYSNTTIYDPGSLGWRLYCFGAVSVAGPSAGSVFCEFGIRAARADVVGILFQPADRLNTNVQSLMRRLDAEYIPHTFLAREFLSLFPDQNYEGILQYDPVKRLGEFAYIYEGRGDWFDKNIKEEFARPVSREMLQARPLGEYMEITIKPDYRPGGRFWRHPLYEVWPE